MRLLLRFFLFFCVFLSWGYGHPNASRRLHHIQKASVVNPAPSRRHKQLNHTNDAAVEIVEEDEESTSSKKYFGLSSYFTAFISSTASGNFTDFFKGDWFNPHPSLFSTGRYLALRVIRI